MYGFTLFVLCIKKKQEKVSLMKNIDTFALLPIFCTINVIFIL